MRPERRRIHVPEPSALEEDQTAWLMTFSDLVIQLFAFALLSAALAGGFPVAAASRPAPLAPPEAEPPVVATIAPLAPATDAQPAAEPATEAMPAPAEPDPRIAHAADDLRAVERDGVAVRIADTNVVVTLSDTVSFASGRAELLPETAPLFRQLGVLARAMPGFDVEVAGHTDDVPIHNAEFPSNLELSLARAARVARALAAEAPEVAERTSVVGYGANRPIAGNADDDGRARNRAVEIRFARRPVAHDVPQP